MCATALKKLSDEALLLELQSIVARDRAITAVLLAHIAEVDERRLYASEGYSSMHAYCVGVLKFSDDEAYKRIQVARAGRSVPALLEALADGRIHLTAARILAPHVTRENVDELVLAASQRSKPELESWVLRRFGGGDRPAFPFSAATATATAELPLAGRSEVLGPQLVPGPVEIAGEDADFGRESATATGGSHACASPQAETPPSNSTSEWLEPARITLKIVVDRSTHDRLVYARQLLGHSVPSGDLGQVLARALDVLIAQLERQKSAATDRPRPTAQSPAGTTRATAAVGPERPQRSRARRIPAAVKRAVWRRDEGRCTFVASSGHRCEARHRLEFDHVRPVALGGESTVVGLRLLCRTHNQREAEVVFGTEFMAGRRVLARSGRATRAAPAEGAAETARATLDTAGTHPPNRGRPASISACIAP